jgi:hypothetical protein
MEEFIDIISRINNFIAKSLDARQIKDSTLKKYIHRVD